MENLRQVACGQTVKVKKISGEGPVRKRFRRVDSFWKVIR